MKRDISANSYQNFFLTLFINNIDITFTISTNNTYNTLEYNKRKKKNIYIPYYDLQSTKKSNSPRLQALCQLKVSIYCNNVHLN